MNFSTLSKDIKDTHIALQQQAVKAINRSITIRNWLIGFYIVEFEQHGEDKSKYGEKLLQRLSEALRHESMSYRNLRLYRQFYLLYPHISVPIVNHLKSIGFRLSPIWQSSIAKFNSVCPALKNGARIGIHLFIEKELLTG